MKFDIYFDEPKVVRIEAESEEEARELFMEGEFEDSQVSFDPDGIIDEPKLIIKLEGI